MYFTNETDIAELSYLGHTVSQSTSYKQGGSQTAAPMLSVPSLCAPVVLTLTTLFRGILFSKNGHISHCVGSSYDVTWTLFSLKRKVHIFSPLESRWAWDKDRMMLCDF